MKQSLHMLFRNKWTRFLINIKYRAHDGSRDCFVPRRHSPCHTCGCHGNLAGVWFAYQLWLPQDSSVHFFVNFHHTCGGHFLRLSFGDATTGMAGVGWGPNSPLAIHTLILCSQQLVIRREEKEPLSRHTHKGT